MRRTTSASVPSNLNKPIQLVLTSGSHTQSAAFFVPYYPALMEEVGQQARSDRASQVMLPFRPIETAACETSSPGAAWRDIASVFLEPLFSFGSNCKVPLLRLDDSLIL
jgi:hypothetical protein